MTRKRLTIIIAGGGQIGLLTTQRLNNQGHEVVIIEEDPERCRMLTNEYIATVIEGDATQPQVLEQAEPHMCDVVAALTGNVRTNLTVCTLAKELANIRTVLRSGAEDTTPDAFEGVDAVVHPESFGAAAALNTILSDEVRAVTDTTGEVSLYEVRVTDRAAIAGKQLRNVALPYGSRIVADVTDGTVINTDTPIEAGKIYLIAAEPDQAEEVLHFLRE